MEEMENLKKKIENKKNKTSEQDNNIDTYKLIQAFDNDIKKVYRRINTISKDQMKKLGFIDSKQDEMNNKLDKILELLQNNNVDVEEIQKQKEIMELEEKLKKLKGGE